MNTIHINNSKYPLKDKKLNVKGRLLYIIINANGRTKQQIEDLNPESNFIIIETDNSTVITLDESQLEKLGYINVKRYNSIIIFLKLMVGFFQNFIDRADIKKP